MPSWNLAACVAYRSSDGMLIAGERAPAGTSVDLHMIRLQGNAVLHDFLFSTGTSASAGEIPQCAPMSDGRVVVAATDLQPGGPLAQFQTLQYNWEGIGIVDPNSGAVTPIAIANLNQFPGVINGLALSKDEQTVYVTNWISSSQGDLWAVPIGGGTAVQVATLPSPGSNVGVDNDGTVLITALNGPPNLFRFDPSTSLTTPIVTTTGPLNAVTVEHATGNYVLATANSGLPVRSLVWMTPGGVETVLLQPNMATISAIGVNDNPEAYGTGTAGQASQPWQVAPNPGGLPLVGNQGFSLTLTADSNVPSLAFLVLSPSRPAAPVNLLGVDVHIGLANASMSFFQFTTTSHTLPMPIPNLPALIGISVFAQTLHLEVTSQLLGASPGLQFTVL